jgi:putative ABC transport system permease protein
MDNLLKDLRYGLRMLIKNPGFTVVAVIALTLGIGANSAIFSVVNAVLLRPLPYDDPDKLMIMSERSPQLEGMSISYPNFLDWREQNQVFEHIAVFRRQSYNLTGSGEPERLTGGIVSADMFPALKATPIMGRTFTNDEDKPGGALVTVLSYGLWQRRFGADPSIVGQSLTLNGKPYTVIGVMPQGFLFPSRVELWIPVGHEYSSPNWQNRGNHPGLYGVARLKEGVTLEQARTEMDAIAARLEEQYPNTNIGGRVSITPLYENVVRGIRPALLVLLGAVGFVLLIACANVANLLLARAAARQKEIAVRTALGASRTRLIRQLLTESVLLSLAGGALGLVLANWGVDLIVAVSPNNIPRVAEIGLDSRVVIFTLAVSMLTGIIFGLVPALQASKPDLNETLKDAGRGSTGGLHRQIVRRVLVVAEVALSLVLLVGAGLTIRSFYRLGQVNPGFSTDNLLTLQVSLPAAKYPTPEQRLNFYEQTRERIAALPGVQSAAVATGLPLGNNGNQTSFTIEGQPDPPPGETPLMEVVYISPDYLKTMNIPLLAGRAFSYDDKQSAQADLLPGRAADSAGRDSPGVLIIDETFAKRYWPDEDPIGKRVRFGGRGRDNPLLTVVGIVGRVKMEGLNVDSNRVQGYLPYMRGPWNSMTFVARTAGDPQNLAAAARQEVLAVDGDLPVFSVRTLEQIQADSVAPQRLNMLLLGIFAGVALILAGVGIYGVMAYSVTQRTHEIGIRMALGARRGDVVKLVVGQGMLLSLVGVALGLGAAFALTRVMSSLLFEVSATDPATFFGISALLVGVALVACFVPALRASRVDPMVALRYE